MKIIVTGFEPFGGRSSNKSLDTIKHLQGVETAMLRVSWEDCKGEIENIIEERNPDFLLLLGEAGSYKCIKIEEEAHNIASGIDNYGIQKDMEKIDEKSEFTIKTKADLSKMDTEISNDAGKYLCNYSYFYSLKLLDGNALFIHVPVESDEYENALKVQGIINILLAN